VVGEPFGLEEVPEALHRLADGDTVGRIVVTP